MTISEQLDLWTDPPPADASSAEASSPDFHSRFAGGLLGLACGDALGAPIELLTREGARQSFGTVTEMVGGGVWAAGEWTDDTGMALCVAEGVLENPQDPVPGTGRRFLEWAKSAKDVGGTISEALRGFRANGDWAKASRETSQARTGMAAGNGSLMRTLPVALAYSDPRTMLVQSARISAMTHWDPQAEVCCAIYCLWIRQILDGVDRYAAWREALRQARDYEEGGALALDTPGPTPLPEHFWIRLENVTDLVYADLQPSGYAGYSLECLEAAAWCAIFSDGAEQAIIDAVNLGGESDTIGAVAGGVVGVHWGVDDLPERWLERLCERQRIEKLGKELARTSA